MMLMLNVPATVGLIVLAEPIVAMIYQREMFTSTDTINTATALMFYAPGLIGYSAVKIASPTFYSLRDSRTPVIVSVLSVGVNLALNLVLVRVLGFKGLALGTAIAAILNAVVLLWLLRRRLGGLDGRRVAVSLTKIAVASAVMGVAAHVMPRGLPGDACGGELAKIARVAGAIAVALLVLAASARLLRIQEFNEATSRVLARFGSRPRESLAVQTAPDGHPHGVRAHDGRRLRQHPRAAAAAADHSARSQPRGGRHDDDVVPAVRVGGAGRLRAPRRPLEPSPPGDGGPGAVDRRSSV